MPRSRVRRVARGSLVDRDERCEPSAYAKIRGGREIMRAARKSSCFLGVASAMMLLVAPSGARTHSPASSSLQSASQNGQDHSLLLYNTHTAERIELVYRRGDQFIPSALAKLDYFLRDHRTGDVRH